MTVLFVLGSFLVGSLEKANAKSTLKYAIYTRHYQRNDIHLEQNTLEKGSHEESEDENSEDSSYGKLISAGAGRTGGSCLADCWTV